MLSISRIYSNPSKNFIVKIAETERVNLLNDLLREFIEIINKIEIDLHNSVEGAFFSKKQWWDKRFSWEKRMATILESIEEHVFDYYKVSC